MSSETVGYSTAKTGTGRLESGRPYHPSPDDCPRLDQPHGDLTAVTPDDVDRYNLRECGGCGETITWKELRES